MLLGNAKPVLEELHQKIKEYYKSDFGINLKAIIAKPGSGIKVVKY